MTQHNITLLGGTGFVGHYLCNALAHYPHQVKVLTRDPARYRELAVLPNVTLVVADVFNPDSLTQALHGCDVVVNLVGILNPTRTCSFYQAHVELVKHLIAACQQQRVSRLLHISALNAHPQAPSEYLRTKGQAEQCIQAAHDLHSTIFQPSVIFGPGDHFFTLFAQLLRLAPGIMLLPCAESLHAPVYVGDVVHALISSIDNKQTFAQVYPLSGPEVFSLQELVQMVAYTLEKKCYILGLNSRLSKIAAQILQYFPGQPLTPDNYLSSTLPSVAKVSFPQIFNLQPARIHNIIPQYLGKSAFTDPYAEFRKRRTDNKHQP